MLSDLRNPRGQNLATARDRANATATSDTAFLVDLDDLGRSDLRGLLMGLQELLGHNADVVTP
jgi:hypothetical protein